MAQGSPYFTAGLPHLWRASAPKHVSCNFTERVQIRVLAPVLSPDLYMPTEPWLFKQCSSMHQ